MTLYGAELVRVADVEEAARVVAEELVTAARAGQAIVLTGGTTPGHAYTDPGTPASLVRSAGGRTRVVADAGAASRLDS